MRKTNKTFSSEARALDLSRIYAAPITRLGCLAFEGQGAFAPQS
jgi:hypothetical protein